MEITAKLRMLSIRILSDQKLNYLDTFSNLSGILKLLIHHTPMTMGGIVQDHKIFKVQKSINVNQMSI